MRSAGLVLTAVLVVAGAEGAVADVQVELASSVVETTPVLSSGDSADDPAIWIHPTDPAGSLVIGNDKGGGLEVYDLAGVRVQRISSPTGFWGNVDVRGDLVFASKAGIRVYRVDAATSTLVPATEDPGVIETSGEGLCAYDPGQAGVSDGLFAYTVVRANGRVRQYSLTDSDSDGLLTGTLVRDFVVGTESEGCVTDEETGSLFVSEEDVALWRYGAAASSGAVREMVAPASADLPPDIEGLAVADRYLFVSAQRAALSDQSWINVYSRFAPYSYVKSVRIAAGTASDDCDGTDGIAATASNLGPAFPQGLFVCQDGQNGSPAAGNQNFKYVPLERVTAAPAAPALSAISLDPSSVVGGNTSQGTATLTSAAPAGGAEVTLTSSDTSAATAPASVTVPAGATSGTFTATTSSVTASTPVSIGGTFGGVTRSATLTVLPPAAPAALSALAVSPSSVTGGGSARGTVTVTSAAPADGFAVALSSSSGAAAVPAGVSVPAGATSTTFPITTSAVTTSTPVTITASAGDVVRTATLTVTPAADSVAPTALSLVPANGATGRSVGSNATVRFSETVTGVNTTSFTLRNTATNVGVSATVTFNSAVNRWVLNPHADLVAGTSYTASLSAGITDLAGNTLAPVSWSFTTAGSAPGGGGTDTTAPTVTARSPGTGATGVGRFANVTATFSEAVQGVSGGTFTLRNSGTGALISAVVSRDGTTNRWILNPGAGLAARTQFTVRLNGGATAIRDLAGNPLADSTWSFTTGG